MQVLYDVHGLKEYLHEFERIRFQRITADDFMPQANDSVMNNGTRMNVKSRRNIDFYTGEPSTVYLSSGGKDSVGNFKSGMYGQEVMLMTNCRFSYQKTK
jgi:hypothetical protein